MRKAIFCLLLAAPSAISAQTAEALRARYGPPNPATQTQISETFSLHDEFTLTAEYGPDHIACKLVIAPSQTLHDQARSAAPLSLIRATVFTREIISLGITGSKKSDIALPSVRVIDFENARILEPIAGRPLRGQGVSKIVASFKRPVCPPPDDPVEVYEKSVLPLIPNASELRTRFSVSKTVSDLSPDVAVISDIKLHVSYGSDRRACSITLEAADPTKGYMPSLQVSQLLDILAPPTVTGNRVGAYGFQSSECGGGSTEAYEYAQIARIHNFCERSHGGTDQHISVQFPRSACE